MQTLDFWNLDWYGDWGRLIGLRLTHTAADPIEAANVATWLGRYVKDVAASEAVREQVALSKVGNLQFSDRARKQKIKV